MNWVVVQFNEDGTETVSKPMDYPKAFRLYESRSKKHPKNRYAIRKANQ